MDVVTVSTSAELLAALDAAFDYPTTIRLEPGDYFLDAERATHAVRYLSWEEVTPDATSLVLRGYTGLTLTAADPDDPPRLVTRDHAARVLTFTDSRRIELSNLVAGHLTGPGEVCLATVLAFDTSSQILLDEVDLFGSGTHGLYLNDVIDFEMRESVIRECTQGLVVVDGSRDVVFTDSRFTTTHGYCIFAVERSSGVLVEYGSFEGNSSSEAMFCSYNAVREPVRVVGSRFESNFVDALENRPGVVQIEDSDLHGMPRP